MKKSFLMLILFQLLVSSCKKDKVDICDSQICIEYQNIWEELFKTRNNITDEYFKEHLTITNTSISSWNSGESFKISYFIKIDWAKIYINDQFIIKKNSSAPPFPSLNLPVDTYLSKDEINLCINNFVLASSMKRINQYEKLKFNSKRKAIKEIEKNIPFKNPKMDMIYYKDDKYIYTSNGNPFLKGGGTIDDKENKCFTCEIDLITGEVTYNETYCWIE